MLVYTRKISNRIASKELKGARHEKEKNTDARGISDYRQSSS